MSHPPPIACRYHRQPSTHQTGRFLRKATLQRPASLHPFLVLGKLCPEGWTMSRMAIAPLRLSFAFDLPPVTRSLVHPSSSPVSYLLEPERNDRQQKRILGHVFLRAASSANLVYVSAVAEM